jgi:anaerobic magnesium-protoporphyrin IX monomethyl ester cyclase
LDCTFISKPEALSQAHLVHAEVVGLYCMVTMLEDCLWFARQLRSSARLLVAGGPLPTCDPHPFLDDFDVIVRGEGEITMLELLHAYGSGGDFSKIPGIILSKKMDSESKIEAEILFAPDRPFIPDLDTLPFPARHLLPNQRYIQFGKKQYGYGITTVMSTRGCPYECEFCSNVFRRSFR